MRLGLLVPVLVVVVTLLFAACSLGSAPIPERCERIGDRCVLREGLLGVCAPTEGNACAEPPCLACLPQH